MMMMMNCFCGMVDRGKAFSLISSRDHCQRFSPSQISNTPGAGFEPVQSLSSGLVEWSCALVITTTPRRHGVKTRLTVSCSYKMLWYFFIIRAISLSFRWHVRANGTSVTDLCSRFFSARIWLLSFVNQSFPLSIPSLKTIISYLVHASEKGRYCSVSKLDYK